MHGITFRESIRLLHKLFLGLFFPLVSGIPCFWWCLLQWQRHWWFLFQRSPMSIVPTSDFFCWRARHSFDRGILMFIGFVITSEIGKQAIPLLVQFLSANPTMYACLFVNFLWKCSKWSCVLEGQLVTEKVKAFVLQITGEMDKYEKFGLIRLSSLAAKMDGIYACSLPPRPRTRESTNHY